MARKYTSPLTAKLTPDNWQDKLNLNELSLEDRLDLLGDFKAMLSFAKRLEGYLKEAVRAAMPEGEDEYTGNHFYVQINHRVRKGGYDIDHMREDMGDDWLVKYEKEPVEYDELRLSAVEEGEEVA